MRYKRLDNCGDNEGNIQSIIIIAILSHLIVRRVATISGNMLGGSGSNLPLLLLLLAFSADCRFTIVNVFVMSLLLQKRKRVLANVGVVNSTDYLQPVGSHQSQRVLC